MITISPIKFGTDGWRGAIAADFTFDNVRACAQGTADYINHHHPENRTVVIGYDNRFASEHFAAACAEVLAANGVKSYLCGKGTPTPVVSFGVTYRKAAGGIVITASHNPATDNGFKYKNEFGSSAPPEITGELEGNINRVLVPGRVLSIPLSEAQSQGLVEPVSLDTPYLEQIKRLLDVETIRNSGLDVVYDAMYGVGAGYYSTLLSGGNICLSQLNCIRNPLFPGMKQPEPISINLGSLLAAVRTRKASVGVATDGDADRVGIVDENGVFLTQLEIFALLAYYLLEVRGERGAIVKTITSTSMLDRLGEIYGVPVRETAVGFKYVAPIMLKENALIGGEESGGYGFRGHVLERDGIIAGLYFLDFMVRTGQSPAQLLAQLFQLVGPHVYRRNDIRFSEAEREKIEDRLRDEVPSAIAGARVDKFQTIDGFRFLLAGNEWLLIRFSGTEPLMRIYAEAGNLERVEKILAAGRQLAGV